MLCLPNLRKKPSSPACRGWLARRRCLRALRATIVFIVLYTPFLYFGYILCCRMPYNLGSALPNWILLYEFWIFLRNVYVFSRYIWKASILAFLPLLLNIYFIFNYPPGPSDYITDKIYLNFFKKERMTVIQMIQDGKLGRIDTQPDTMFLPQRYEHLAMRNGLILYVTKDGLTSVIFSTAWDIVSLDMGLCYIPDNNPSKWLRMNRISFYEKLEDHWYFISPELGYFLNIMDTPQAKTSQNKFTE